MKQMLFLYLFFLPLQIIKHMRYMAVPTTLLVSWAFLGLDAIANEIEGTWLMLCCWVDGSLFDNRNRYKTAEPFGDDQNDLPLDYFVKKLQVCWIQ